MSTNARFTWPTASLDRIARLKVLAAGLPGTVVVETVLDAPLEEAWPRITDFERSVHEFDMDVARIKVLRRSGDPDGQQRLRMLSLQTARVLWIPSLIDVDLAPGWCWMVNRPQTYVVGMAAEPDGPDGQRTRFALVEGLSLHAPGPLQPLLRPLHALSRWRHRRHLPHDIAGVHRYLAGGGAAPPRGERGR